MLIVFKNNLCSCQGSLKTMNKNSMSPASYLLNKNRKLDSLRVDEYTFQNNFPVQQYVKRWYSVEVSGLEPLTSCLQSRRSTN